MATSSASAAWGRQMEGTSRIIAASSALPRSPTRQLGSRRRYLEHPPPHRPPQLHADLYRSHSEMRQCFDDGGVSAEASAFLRRVARRVQRAPPHVGGRIASVSIVGHPPTAAGARCRKARIGDPDSDHDSGFTHPNASQDLRVRACGPPKCNPPRGARRRRRRAPGEGLPQSLAWQHRSRMQSLTGRISIASNLSSRSECQASVR